MAVHFTATPQPSTHTMVPLTSADAPWANAPPAAGLLVQGMAELDELANLANTCKVPKAVNMHEAKSTLSKLVEEAEAGEEIILARAGQPVALVPVRAGKPRQLGQWQGRVRMADDFDAPLPDDVLAGFEGR